MSPTDPAEVTAIGVDVGTTNVKVAIVDAVGEMLATAHRPVRTHQDGEVGEQDADELWAAVLDAVADVTASAPSAAEQVTAITVTAQYSSIVPVDHDGAPVAPMVLWTDDRGADHCWAILGEHEEAFELWLDHHGIPPIGGGLSLSHLLHFQHDRPEVHAATATWLEPADFVNLRLTGRGVATQGSMLTSQLCDNRTLDATDYDEELVVRSGLDADRLPPLLAAGEAVGPVLDEVAERLGLGRSVTVQAGCRDTIAGVIATGAHRPGRGGLSIGTTSFFMDTVPEKRFDLDHELLAVPDLFGETYVLLAENGIGGRALEHVLGQFFLAGDVLADHRTDDEFARLDAVLDSVPAGSGGVLFLPWLNGSQSPASDGNARGAFLNLSLNTGRVEMVRAVAEGIAHNLAWLLPHVESFTGQSMDEIVLAGGAARSAVWCQILADVLDRPVIPLVEPDRAVARGAAGLALEASRVIGREALIDWVPLGDRHVPDPDVRAGYDLAQSQFEAAFAALAPIHEALNG